MPLSLSDLDLAALMCSRICHDLISPVGAISNGLEVLDEEHDASMRQMALDLVRKSASQASAKLQFCRIAFGAAGAPDTLLDLGEAGEVAKLFIGTEKIRLEWSLPRDIRAKQEVKIVLNTILMAMSAIPRGGVIVAEELLGGTYRITALGEGAKIPEKMASIVEHRFDPSEFDARLIQLYYTMRLVQNADFNFSLQSEPGKVIFLAQKKEQKPLLEEDAEPLLVRHAG